jgi:hypothetical protein
MLHPNRLLTLYPCTVMLFLSLSLSHSRVTKTISLSMSLSLSLSITPEGSHRLHQTTAHPGPLTGNHLARTHYHFSHHSHFYSHSSPSPHTVNLTVYHSRGTPLPSSTSSAPWIPHWPHCHLNCWQQQHHHTQACSTLLLHGLWTLNSVTMCGRHRSWRATRLHLSMDAPCS